MPTLEEQTQSNSVAISELTIIAKQTSKDVDKLVRKIDEIPEVRIIALEKRVGKVEIDCSKRSWLAFTTILGMVGALLYHFFIKDL